LKESGRWAAIQLLGFVLVSQKSTELKRTKRGLQKLGGKVRAMDA
jgi:hypothetical protein